MKEGLGLTGDTENVSGSVLCLNTGGVAFLRRMECALTPPPEPVYRGVSLIMAENLSGSETSKLEALNINLKQL